MLRNHILIALRNLARGRFSTFINIFGLALGMATTLFILMWVQNEWNYDTYHKESARIYRMHSHIKISDDETWNWGTTPLLMGDLASTELPEVTSFTKLKTAWGGKIFRLNGRIFKEENIAYVHENWFELFDYQFIEGNGKDFFQHPQSLILTRSKAEKLFGNTNVTGEVIQIDTSDFVIRGVVTDNPTNSTFQFDYLIPVTAHLADPETYNHEVNWGNFNYVTFLKLNENTNPRRVSEKLTTTLRANKTGDSTTYVSLLPLAEMHFDNSLMSDSFEHGNSRTPQIFSIIGLLILLIACINYVSLTTAKASVRAKEISVKKIIGAGKASLFGQFMTESVITSLIALVVAIGFVHLSLPFFNQIVKQQFVFDYQAPTIWMVLLGTTLLAIILTGIYPAFLLSSFKPVKMLRGANWLGGNNAQFRKSLVVVQFVISTVLIISVIVISQQNRFIKTKNLGYDRENVFSVTIPYNAVSPEQRNGLSSIFTNQLLAQSSIDQVTTANGSIVDSRSTHSGSLDWEGRDPNFQPSVAQLSADAAFQRVFGLELLEGRWFEEGNVADASNVVLNETAVKTFNLRPPYVGQRFAFQGAEGQVIGVVKDFHFRSLREKIMPMVLSNRGSWHSQIFVKTTGERTAEALAATRKIWQDALPGQPFEYEFLDESFEQLYLVEQRTALLFNIFATIAFVISCLGLFGLATFATERRTKEIGIRKVLGASMSHLVTLLSREFLGLVAFAFLIAAPIGWWAMNRWLQDFAYRIDIQWWMFVSAGLAAVVITLVTVSFQAIRAALANPVESLRSE